MKRRIAKKIFVYGTITWNVPDNRWRKVVYKLFKSRESRQGWINFMRGLTWYGEFDPTHPKHEGLVTVAQKRRKLKNEFQKGR